MAPVLAALLAEKLHGYRSSFDRACSGLFGGGASVVLEYVDDDEDGVAPSPASTDGAAASNRGSGSTDIADDDDEDVPTDVSRVAALPARAPAAAAPTAPPMPLPEDYDDAPTVSAAPDAAAVRRDLESTVRAIATDFAATFNDLLAERAKIDPVADAVAPRYEFGPQHIGELQEALAEPLAPLLRRLDRADLDGARRASIDAWLPLERRIREKWQAYFVLTFQDLSVEIRAERDRKRLMSGRLDVAAVEAIAASHSSRLVLSDLAAPRPVRSLRSPLLALLALLALAIAGGWLLAHSSGHQTAATGSR
jgi:hypothetical protein